jgi:phosphate-selective porin
MFSYGEQGLQFDDGTGNNFLWFGVRLQTRWSNSEVTQDDLPGAPSSSDSDFALNRGRLKLGGHLFSPAFTIYSEHDIVDNRLLDLRATYKFTDWLSIRIGQWKSEFNRERIDSSGKQQFVERSVVTPWFTIDRQQAIMASGRVGKGSRGDTSYWFGWLSGAGRGGDTSDADGLWLGRAQWNFNGRVLGFSQSAIGRPGEPAGSVAVAAVTGRSGYTAFSSAGGGQLPGFVDGEPDQYRLEQVMLETAYQHGGFSWQQELHWKSIDDSLNGETRRLISFPEPLELAIRFARVDPDRDLGDDTEKEYTLASNWFFKGHRNKLTLDLSRVIRRQAPETDTSNRIRLQWDWSF